MRTRSPCSQLLNCDELSGTNEELCAVHGTTAPAFCREKALSTALTPPQLIERYGATVAAEEKDSNNARARIAALRGKIEPLAAKHKESSAAIAKDHARFADKLRLARTTYDKFKLASKTPKATGVEASRQASFTQFDEVVQLGRAIEKGVSARDALASQLSTLSSEVSSANLVIGLATQDAKNAKVVVDGLTAELNKTALKAQAAAKAAQALGAKNKTADTQAKAATATATSAAGATTSAAAEVIRAKVAASTKALQALDAEAGREARALATLSGVTPAGATARSAAFNAAKKTGQELIKAQASLSEVNALIKAATARRRPSAPKAKDCDLARVDLRNFTYYPYGFDDPGHVFKDGKDSNPNYADADFARPVINGIKLFDLDGNGKPEAIVFIEGMPGAHTGPNNELHFLELDEQCSIQVLQVLTGGVFEGTMKGASYFYDDTVFSTPEGQSGNFATGTETVELRYLNGEMREVRRKPNPN